MFFEYKGRLQGLSPNAPLSDSFTTLKKLFVSQQVLWIENLTSGSFISKDHSMVVLCYTDLTKSWSTMKDLAPGSL